MSPELVAQRLQGRVALVTGGGGTNSIGRSISLRLAAEGAKVGVLDIDGPGAIRVADEIKAAGGEAIPITCDITHLDQCEAAAKLLADTYGGKIDILVNNAAAFRGVMSKQPWQAFDEWKVEDWDYMLDVNLRGMWFCARAVYPYMKPQGYGKIINLTSSTFWEGVAGFIHYVSSKGGIIGFTRALARELGPDGIRVNALPPVSRSPRPTASRPRAYPSTGRPRGRGSAYRSGTRRPTTWPVRPTSSRRATATS